jgi:hypothetical protein
VQGHSEAGSLHVEPEPAHAWELTDELGNPLLVPQASEDERGSPFAGCERFDVGCATYLYDLQVLTEFRETSYERVDLTGGDDLVGPPRVPMTSLEHPCTVSDRLDDLHDFHPLAASGPQMPSEDSL